MANKTKKLATIKIDADKCNGCRSCEMICSAFHADPKYRSNNPARSRIRVVRHPFKDTWVPIFAGENTPAEYRGRDKYVIDGELYDDYRYCRVSCLTEDTFKEPDTGLPLECDMCENDFAHEKPLCVKWCVNDALVYEERAEEKEEHVMLKDIEVGLESMVDKYGWQRILDTIARMATAKKA